MPLNWLIFLFNIDLTAELVTKLLVRIKIVLIDLVVLF